MRLNFQVSQTTDLKPDIVIERVFFNLRDKKYRIRSLADYKVIFDDENEPWKLILRSYKVRRLDGGKFEVTVSDGGVVLRFDYYMKMSTPIIVISIFIVIAFIFVGYQGAAFLAVSFVVIQLLQIFISKGVAIEMLDEMLQKTLP